MIIQPLICFFFFLLNIPLLILTYARIEACVTTELQPHFHKRPNILSHLHVFWLRNVRLASAAASHDGRLCCLPLLDRSKVKNWYRGRHSRMRRQIKVFRKKQKWSYSTGFLPAAAPALLTHVGSVMWKRHVCFTYSERPLNNYKFKPERSIICHLQQAV